MSEDTSVPTLAVAGLDVEYTVRGRQRTVLQDVSFEIAPGECFGLVGESGCGKSTAAMAVVRHLAANGRVSAGSVRLEGTEVLTMDSERLRHMRSREISMVYQEPTKALNPSMRIADQLGEVFTVAGLGKQEARESSATMLTRVQISSPDRVLDAYPHMLSGGMAQRVVIAMALAADPALLILDEPTTALDATVGAEVLEIVQGLHRELGTSILLISHNLGLIGQMCDRVGVLYAGELVEQGPTGELFDRPRHPYTAGLLECIPDEHNHKSLGRLLTIPGALPGPDDDRIGCRYSARCVLADDRCRTEAPPLIDLNGRESRCFHHDRADDVRHLPVAAGDSESPVPDYSADPVLLVEHASKTFGGKDTGFRALNDVSLSLWAGETLGIVGESGSGKTTLARVVMGLTAPDDCARLEMAGRPVGGGRRKQDAAQARLAQIVFQNPDAALNRRHSVRQIIGRAITKLAGLRGTALRERLMELADGFRLSAQHLQMRPLRLSGGLKQRVAIARAFAGEPQIVVCDEPTSALDVSVQASILNLLVDLQRRRRVAYLFISHDLAVVQYLADRIAVMYLGRIMELGPARQVLDGPHHPYTEILLSSVPSPDAERHERLRMVGEPPDTRNPPPGCPFQTRCPHKIGAICEEVLPELVEDTEGHAIRCHLPLDELPRRTPRSSENLTRQET